MPGQANAMMPSRMAATPRRATNHHLPHTPWTFAVVSASVSTPRSKLISQIPSCVPGSARRENPPRDGGRPPCATTSPGAVSAAPVGRRRPAQLLGLLALLGGLALLRLALLRLVGLPSVVSLLRLVARLDLDPARLRPGCSRHLDRQ